MGNNAGKLAGEPPYSGLLGPTRSGNLIRSLVLTIQQELVRLAERAVEKGDPFYSVAILLKSDLSLVACGRDKTKSTNPTSTAELNAIQGLFDELPSNARPSPKDCIFLCVHEPPPLALCQIAQSGFDNVVFLFSREASKALGAPPSPIALNEIFAGVTLEEEYKRENAYFTAFPLNEMIEKCERREGHMDIVEAVTSRYRDMMTAETSMAPQTPDKQTAKP